MDEQIWPLTITMADAN